jgi:hypothetical protein
MLALASSAFKPAATMTSAPTPSETTTGQVRMLACVPPPRGFLELITPPPPRNNHHSGRIGQRLCALRRASDGCLESVRAPQVADSTCVTQITPLEAIAARGRETRRQVDYVLADDAYLHINRTASVAEQCFGAPSSALLPMATCEC